jgi:DMSO/TMAO reductase YedYZ molybdopterin-dependent catalytic subunit
MTRSRPRADDDGQGPRVAHRQGAGRVSAFTRGFRGRRRVDADPARVPPGDDFLALPRPGFWEGYWYHNYPDPWREQRYAGD